MNTEEDAFFNEEALADARDEIRVEPAKAESTVSHPKITTEMTGELDDEPEGQLTIDVYQTPMEIVVESAIAGVNPDDIDINVTNDSISIRGSRKREKEVKGDDYFYQECYWGRFSRSVILPQEVDPERVKATIKNGILTVRMPKLKRQRSKKVQVKLE